MSGQGHDRDDDAEDGLAPVVGLPRSRDDAEDLLARLGDALPGPPRWLRFTVAVLAVAQSVVALPWLVGADPLGLLEGSTAAHLTRDGALGLVVSVGGCLVAWRPRWSLPCFAFASAAIVAQAVAGVFDEPGVGLASSELLHVPSLVLTCLIGLVGVRLRPLGPVRRAGR
ncbi:MAG: hypothetical protein FJW83_05535 [Actinobacteria bacterium]|nr:hypothetical protein [Actinomycetota bacterium]